MKRVSLLLGVSLFTFSLGTGATQFCRHALRPTLAAVNAAFAPSGPPSEAIRVSFRSARWDASGTIVAAFEVENGSREALYYRGYGQDDNQDWVVRRGGALLTHGPFCGTGLAERTLLPGETATFLVEAGREAGEIEVGVSFAIGEARRRRTVWGGTFTAH